MDIFRKPNPQLIEKINTALAELPPDERHSLTVGEVYRYLEKVLQDGGASPGEVKTVLEWTLGCQASLPRLHTDVPENASLFRIRASLNNSFPPIWRELLIPSSTYLDEAHQALQVAFDWMDYHQWEFTLPSPDPEEGDAVFGSPLAMDEMNVDGEYGFTIRLDQVLHDVGDTLGYLYDFGDNWDLTLTLLEILPLNPSNMEVKCTDGSRAAPPEDCGGRRMATELAEILANPEEFSTNAVNEHLDATLNDSYIADLMRYLHGAPDTNIGKVLHSLPLFQVYIDRLGLSQAGIALGKSLLTAISDQPTVSPEEAAQALSTIIEFLKLIAAEGESIKLTAAGYIPPKIAKPLFFLLEKDEWNRRYGVNEYDWHSLHETRLALTKLGLLRKSKGRLSLTKAALAGIEDPHKLWRHLAGRLLPMYSDIFSDHAASLILALLANHEYPDTVKIAVEILNQAGWSTEGRPVERITIIREAAPALTVLQTFEPVVGTGSNKPSVVSKLAHAAIAVAYDKSS